MGYRRAYNGIEIKKGANWFSITDTLVDYLINHENEIYSLFHYALCIDEMFVQTMLWNSPLKDRIYSTDNEFKGCVRLIDWKRGNPWVWRKDDFNAIINSDKMFARKFSSSIDKEIIDKLYDYIKSK